MGIHSYENHDGFMLRYNYIFKAPCICIVLNEHNAYINYLDDLVIQKRKVCFCCLCTHMLSCKQSCQIFLQSCVQNINGEVPLVLCLYISIIHK